MVWIALTALAVSIVWVIVDDLRDRRRIPNAAQFDYLAGPQEPVRPKADTPRPVTLIDEYGDTGVIQP